MDKSFDFCTLLRNHEKKYQHKPTSIKNVSTGIQRRLEKNLKYRKSSRLSIFDSIRNLQSNEAMVTEKQKKVEHRRMQLEKWKEQKEKKKKEAASQKKKPFVIGISHPSLKYVPPPLPPKPMPSSSGRVTRSQTRGNTQVSLNIAKPSKSTQSFAPKNAAFKPDLKIRGHIPSLAPKAASKKVEVVFEPVDSQTSQRSHMPGNKKTGTSNAKESTLKEKKSHKPKGIKKSKSPSRNKLKNSSSQSDEDSSHNLQIKNKTPRKSNIYKMVSPENKMPKSESSTEERLRSPKSSEEGVNCNELSVNNLVHSPMTPEQIQNEVQNISPCVTLSRGKTRARKETMLKLAEGLLDEDNGHTGNVEYFRRQLDVEVMRITEMCDQWEKISQQLPLSDSVQELVLGAVGQARLLVSQKLAQFGSLVCACAHPEPGAALVTTADLHGFWDMVFMQIENVDMRFKKLEEIRARNWVEEVPVLQKKRTQKVLKNSFKPAATSRLRDLIAAARKAKKEQQPQETGSDEHKEAEPVSKTFDAGFFRVSSPVKSPSTPLNTVTSTPPNVGSARGLLKAVLSSEAKKASANSASLAMMRASIIGKNIETESFDGSQHEAVATTPVTVSETPARSILKSANKASARKKSSKKKSIKVVLFDNSYTETQSGESSGLITDKPKIHEMEKESNKENDKKNAKFRRQDAVEERSPVLTRSRRKSLGTLLDMSIGMLEEQLKIGEKETAAAGSNQTPRRSRRISKSSAADDLKV